MVELIAFISLGLIILILFEWRARRDAKQSSGDGQDGTAEPQGSVDGECCGQHLVCERETLLQTNAVPEYFDDEELDTLAGIPADDYTETQREEIRAVFETLEEKDVPAWCRSIQLRNIALPEDIREEALLICRERRASRASSSQPR